MSEADIREERLKKLQLLRDAGMDPYPVESHCDTWNKEFVEQFETLGNKEIILAGRLMAKRGRPTNSSDAASSYHLLGPLRLKSP